MLDGRFSRDAFLRAPAPAELAGELARALSPRVPRTDDFATLCSAAEIMVEELRALGHPFTYADEDGASWVLYGNLADAYPRPFLNVWFGLEEDEGLYAGADWVGL